MQTDGLDMDRAITSIVIVGGGTAGWLAACLIAARADRDAEHPLQVTLIESPDVATIGVGEGTWPTMRRTLERIGISETEFLLACDAAFKQGSRFDGWRTGAPDDRYLHPFTLPPMQPPAISPRPGPTAVWPLPKRSARNMPSAARTLPRVSARCPIMRAR
ncbi:tryptophan 7-halogenase [Sphingomonas sp. Ant20]|uniref:tryptophan 7-halogenase n=1 Tax=Sphingomonas sp. Ant20 TaxID=104605 RepID=UPI00325FD67A